MPYENKPGINALTLEDFAPYGYSGSRYPMALLRQSVREVPDGCWVGLFMVFPDIRDHVVVALGRRNGGQFDRILVVGIIDETDSGVETYVDQLHPVTLQTWRIIMVGGVLSGEEISNRTAIVVGPTEPE